MNKTTKTITMIVLGLVIVGLSVWLYLSIMAPVKFDNEFTKRRDACAERLKLVRTLQETYKQTYGCYTASFDTLINRLTNEDSLKITTKVINTDKIPAGVNIADDMTEQEAIKAGYITLNEVYVNPIKNLRENNKLMTKDEFGRNREITDEEIQNCRFVPYPTNVEPYEFDLKAGAIQKSGYSVPVFECKVELKTLLSDMDYQSVINKIAELERINRYPGWKVGDMNQAITDGNFE